MKKFFFIIIFILISFLISILISNYNLTNYDKIVVNNSGSYHQMIKTDSLRYLGHGAEIKSQLKNNVDYFLTGRENYTKYLPPRIAAAYYIFFDKELFNNFDERVVNTGIHFPYLLIQCFFYFFSVALLFFSIKKIFDKRIVFFIILFLCIEPTIFQYHGTFWSESFFFTLQIVILSLVFRIRHNITILFLIGLFLGLLSLQKQMAIFYVIPVLVYFLFKEKPFKFNYLFMILIGYIIVQSFVGYNNFKRSGEFYFLTADTKINLHFYMVQKVVPKVLNITEKKFTENEGKEAFKWIKINSINYDIKKLSNKLKKPGYMDYRVSIINEKDKTQFDEFIYKRTIFFIKKYPIEFVEFIIKKSIHTTLLNPFHIYSDHNFVSGEYYYTTKTHNQLVPYRIVYTMIIYLICLLGFFQIINRKHFQILSFLFLSILYFYLLVSWHGNTRYFVPVLIYLSFFFGFGVDKVLLILDKKNIYNES